MLAVYAIKFPVLMQDNMQICNKYAMKYTKSSTWDNYEERYGILKAIIERAKINKPFEDIIELINFINKLYRQIPRFYDLMISSKLSREELKIHVINQETYNIISEGNKSIIFFGPEIFDFAYRGQDSHEYTNCVPSLFRKHNSQINIDNFDDIKKTLLNVAQAIKFQQLINAHPCLKIFSAFNHGYKLYPTPIRDYLSAGVPLYTRYSEDMINYLNKHPLKINYRALAQHYGCKTNLLDVTTKIEVAAFFAIYHTQNNKVKLAEKGEGIIYIIPWYVYDSKPRPGGDFFNIVGWQPLDRTGVQRACVLNMFYGDDLNRDEHVYKLYFKHNLDKSKLIYEKYKDTLMGQDEYTKKVMEFIQIFNKFDSHTLCNAYRELQWYFKNKIAFSFESLTSSLSKDGVIDNLPIIPPPISKFSLQRDYLNEYAERLNRVQYRKVRFVKEGMIMDAYPQSILSMRRWVW